MAPHHFQHEHLGGIGRHRTHVERSLQRRQRDVLGDRTEARAAVGQRQVVVDGLGHVDGGQRVTQRRRQLTDLEAGIGRIAATVVEEKSDVVRLEYRDQPFVFTAIGFQRLELVAARAEGARWRRAQRGNGLCRLLRGIDQVFSQSTQDAVAPGVHGADAVGVPACRFDHAASRGVDDGGNATGLGIESIFKRHGKVSSVRLWRWMLPW